MILADLCSQIVDCAHKTAPIDESGNYFAVGTPAMRENVINFDEARRISHEIFDAWTTRLRPKSGDLLLAREAPVGPVVRIPPEENVAPGQRTVLLRPDGKVVDSRFLYYYLTSPARQDALSVRAAGSTVPHLNVADVREFSTPDVPPRQQQRAIAEVLGALDDKIAANDRAHNLLDQLCATQVHKATLGNQPQCIRDVLVLNYGKSLPASKRVPGSVGVYGSSGLTGSHVTALVNQAGVVVGRKGTVGAVHWADGPHFPIDTTYYVDPIEDDMAEILYYVLKAAPLGELDADSAVPGLNRETAYSQQIRMPTAEAAATLKQTLRERFAWMSSTRKETRALAATRDELLPLLMSGKLRVRHAEKVVSDAV